MFIKYRRCFSLPCERTEIFRLPRLTGTGIIRVRGPTYRVLGNRLGGGVVVVAQEIRRAGTSQSCGIIDLIHMRERERERVIRLREKYDWRKSGKRIVRVDRRVCMSRWLKSDEEQINSLTERCAEDTHLTIRLPKRQHDMLISFSSFAL